MALGNHELMQYTLVFLYHSNVFSTMLCHIYFECKTSKNTRSLIIYSIPCFISCQKWCIATSIFFLCFVHEGGRTFSTILTAFIRPSEYLVADRKRLDSRVKAAQKAGTPMVCVHSGSKSL